MNILNVTPQGLQNTETILRQNLSMRMTKSNLNNHLAEAKRVLKEC